ncbi:uncharacterized protein LOC114315339 [Camellia sinensis]|uniref:uncharacterized protein LOC114315339 n=1 Tax=Camellia sinensis TaxID=4442 RepID=UPI001035F97A|nr:uncharacterized protein LOC114315339 [Camellia sinensis]
MAEIIPINIQRLSSIFLPPKQFLLSLSHICLNTSLPYPSLSHPTILLSYPPSSLAPDAALQSLISASRTRLASNGEPERPLIVHVGRLGVEKSLDLLKSVMD